MMRFDVKKNSRWVYNAMNALLMLMVFAHYVFQLEIPEVVFMGLSVAMVCTCDLDQILATLIMCIPLSMVFGTTYTFLIGFAVWILCYKNQIRVDQTVVPILLLAVWELMHCLAGGFAIKNFIGQFIPFFLYGMLMWQSCGKVDYGFVARCLAACTVTMCLTLLGMVLVRSGYDVSSAFLNMQRLGMAAEESAADVLRINPNSLGIICVLSLSGLLQLLTTGQGRSTDIVMALIMVTCGALTTSRTFLILLLIMVVLFWLTQKGGWAKKLRFAILIAAIAALVFLGLYVVFPVAIDNFVYRFSVSDISSGRNDLLRTYDEFLYSHPDVLMLGVGLLDFGPKVTTQYAVASHVPHNGIQELAVVWGIPGMLMFVGLVGFLLWKGKMAAGKQRLLNYIPLLLLLAKIQVGQMLTSYYTMLAFAFCYLSLAHNFEPNQQTHPVKRKFYKKTLDN
jgi:hypothetical protein